MKYAGQWVTEMIGVGHGRRRVLTTVAVYVFGAAAAVFAAVVVARDGQVAGATFAIAIACFFAACAVVCWRYGGR